MDISTIVIIVLIAIIIGYSLFEDRKRRIIDNAKYHGIIVKTGEHCKVYKIYRSSSYTDGGVYIRHHNVHDFGELMLVFPNKEKIFISEKHLLHCLKVRKHQGKKQVKGKMTNKWAEWIIDPDGWDEKGLSHNDIYLSLY